METPVYGIPVFFELSLQSEVVNCHSDDPFQILMPIGGQSHTITTAHC